MSETTIDSTQRFYARVAGFAYFFNYLTSVPGVLAPSWISGSGNFAERSGRIIASEHLYRTGLASVVIGWVLIVVLAFALYVTLEPVNKRLAQLGLFMELGQASIGAAGVMWSFAALRAYTAANGTGPFQNNQLEALISVARTAGESGFNISMVFLSVGSLIFFSLFYKSGYIPRALAGLGVVGSLIMLPVSVAILIFPEHARTIQLGWAPIGLAEVSTALWLMIVGIRPARGLAGKGAVA